MELKQFFPPLQWLPAYDKKDLKGDLSAGLTVGVMLIPQGMAYAMIAGLPPIYGLYASIIPLIVYALFGTSRQLAVGPVAMVALLVAAGVGTIAEAGSQSYIAMAITLALMVGIIQFALGAFRLGFLVNFLSHPVISGFTSAAALIIGLSQLKHLLGVDIPRSAHINEIIANAIQQAPQTHLPTLGIGLAGIALIVLLKKWNRAIPGPLMAVIFGVLVVWLGGLNQTGVKIVGTVPSGLPSMSFDAFSFDHFNELIPIALAISLVGFMESIAVAKAIQAKHKNYRVDSNQELIGLGLANIAGSLFQSFPVTGGFSRTAVNDQAGAKTGIAPILSASLIALTLLFLTPLFYYLPKAILASVIMVAVFGLIDYVEAKHLWKTDKQDFIALMVTFLTTLILGIEKGILFGVILSLAMLIYRTTRPHMAVLGKLTGTNVYRNIERFPDAVTHRQRLIIRPDARLYFANAAFFRERLETEIENRMPELKTVIIDASSIGSVDSSAIQMLKDVIEEYRDVNIKFIFTALIGPVRDTFAQNKMFDFIGQHNFFNNIGEAVVDCDDSKRTENEIELRGVLQYNN